jgi:hypothetical protein
MRQSEAAWAVSAWRGSGTGIVAGARAAVEQGWLAANGGVRQMWCCTA